MNCDDVASIMDERREARISSAERCALDEHIVDCESCALAWHAHGMLRALPTPSTPHTLLYDTLRAFTTHAPRPRKPASTRIVFIAALATGGAALAAGSFVAFRELAPNDAAAYGAPPTAATNATLAEPPRSVERQRRRSATPDSDLEPDDAPAPLNLVEFLPIVRVPPLYPPSALDRKLEGSVQVRIDIATTGAVENVIAVSSSDPIFEMSAIAAVSRWRYLPRVVAGERVVARGIETIIRFAITDRPEPPAGGASGPHARQIAAETFAAGIEVVWRRIAEDDLRGAELALDELRASYELDPLEEMTAYDVYGYLFTRYLDYGRAIASYEAGFAVADRAGGSTPTQARWRPLADLYFARHQYDMALKTVLRARKAVTAFGRESRDTAAYIEKLRALGVTEETL